MYCKTFGSSNIFSDASSVVVLAIDEESASRDGRFSNIAGPPFVPASYPFN